MAKINHCILRKDRQGIYAQLKGDEVKVGDKIVTGGQQNLSNGALVLLQIKRAWVQNNLQIKRIFN